MLRHRELRLVSTRLKRAVFDLLLLVKLFNNFIFLFNYFSLVKEPLDYFFCFPLSIFVRTLGLDFLQLFFVYVPLFVAVSYPPTELHYFHLYYRVGSVYLVCLAGGYAAVEYGVVGYLIFLRL